MIGLSLGPGGMLRPGTFQFSTAPINSLSAAAHTAGRHRIASASSQTCNISALPERRSRWCSTSIRIIRPGDPLLPGERIIGGPLFSHRILV